MEEAIYALLAPIAGGRRFWVRGSQTAQRPFIVLNRVSGIHGYTMQGPDGLVESRMQIDCYGDSYDDAKHTARAVKAILNGYRGGAIQGVFLDNERDLPASDSGDVSHLFRTSIDVTLHHREG